MKFEERRQFFEKELIKIMKKYNVEVYAANVVANNGEVMPALKILDTKKDGDNTEKKSTSDKEAQKH